MSSFIYLDNHATTRVDPDVLAAMLPYFSERYGNAGSITHALGLEAQAAVESSRAAVATSIAARPEEIYFTSGATESSNLAIRGMALHPRNQRRHLITVATEHAAVRDPLRRLQHEGFRVTFLPVRPQGQEDAGLLDLQQFKAALTDDTCLVSVMLANNEIGALQPIAEISRLCRERNILLHSDATQALGRVAIDVSNLAVDLLSLSAHKVYGPKGVGALYIRNGTPRIRLLPLLNGGGQERGLRSGTLNVPGVVGMGRAAALCASGQMNESERLAELRDRMMERLADRLPELVLNGPALRRRDLRLAANLNVQLVGVQAEALMVELRDRLALSSGSTCSAAQPSPSHVLTALGLSPDEIASSVRIGLGRFNTETDIETAVDLIATQVVRLRNLLG